MKSLLLKGAMFASLAAATTSYADHGYQVDCVEKSRDSVVLKFYGQPITSYGTAQVIPIKRTISQNCFINQNKLQKIDSLIVVGKSYSRRTKLQLLSQGYLLRPEFIFNQGYDQSTRERTLLDIPGKQSPGKLQLLVTGDMDLFRIRVNFTPKHRGYDHGNGDHGRGGYGRGNDSYGRGSGDTWDNPVKQGPRQGPKKGAKLGRRG